MTTTRTFRGSNSARFVKNTPKRNGNFRSAPKEPLDPYIANNPMLNDSITKHDMVSRIDQLDSIMGFERMEHGENDGSKPRKGWLINMHATTIPSENYLAGYSGVDYYFLDEDGGSFKATLQFDPYFFLMCLPGHEAEVEEWLRKELEQTHVKNITREHKDDLALPNHLVGLQRLLIKISFHNVSDLLAARRVLSPIIKQNLLKRDTRDIYLIMNFNNLNNLNGNTESANMRYDSTTNQDPSTYIDDIREYDVPYHVRVSIDQNIRVGKWYDVYVRHSVTTFVEDPSRIAFADPVVLAFDIETTKAPLKFPDAKIDQIMMISYMIDGEGFLITNREIISEDIDDFEYTPKPEYPGVFTIFNEPDEKHLLIRFFEHIRDMRPTVIATFNGDFFDWPFVENRTRFHDMDMFDEIGFAKDNEGEYKSKYCVHMDCFRWVKRDSYLPQGSQGLKAVTTAKLGYNPTELDPELMTPYAYEHPQLLSEYSVSDAVATYYLYFKYVHPFIFSLCTIIPLSPDEVLRKGTGTLCEMLLMVQAYEKGILLPNKHTDPVERFFEGHLLESETYVGGHVESLEAGVFRSDIASDFKIDPKACDELINELHNSIRFCIEVENGKKLEDVENYDEVYNQIKNKLEALRDQPVRKENPLIYHVDVASMYPNIMTSNRLQPDSMKSEEDCAACDFNRPGKNCDRRLEWAWRGEYFPAEMNEYSMIKRTLQNETFPAPRPWLPARTFEELSYNEQAGHIKKRLSDYSRKVYHRIKQTTTIRREAIICQRENPFYVNTVRSFRDRRYEFKTLAKVWKGKVSKIDKNDAHSKDEAKKMVVLYDSLQLAHKVILNSFYGYVMRKGSRWYSMEMAGITCLTGATIIQMARSLVERLGRPLELDTDGIWCILPSSFPENFNLKCKDGKKIFLEYPCSMLNFRVHEKFTNHQYQELVDPGTFKYATKSDNSIFFEVDGPYKAMILPTSKEEGKGLKKRYAVFNHDGTLAELKGFELKRRGELQLIKNFQSDIFKLFLEGDTLDNCYKAVASVANNWLDVLDTKGGMLEDEDLIELICENRSMSKSLEEYGAQKSTSITTARRLGEFLGEEMVKDAGLACKYIISAKPIGSPVTERAIPVSIFSSDKKEMFLKKWLKDPSLTDFDPRSVIDWGYYHERLSSVVQKIITIPAALQGVRNPVPRVVHPDWLKRKITIREDTKQQTHISSFFGTSSKSEIIKKQIRDIEDFNDIDSNPMKPKVARVTTRKRKNAKIQVDEVEENERYAAILNGPCPSMLEDYAGFLDYQKAKWAQQEKNRVQRRRLFGENTEGSHRSTVGSMMRRQAESISGSNWEILQYSPVAGKPGEIKVFVNIEGKIHTFVFHVPRKIFASFKTELSPRRTIQNCEIDSSNAILPNGHDGSHLYKLTMPEAIYQEESNKVGGLLQDPNVIGLYETQIDSVARAVIELGNTISFDDTRVGALGKGLKNGFNFKDLQRVQTENYMTRFEMDIIYLLHLVVNGYEIFVVFKTWEKDARVFILKPSTSAQEILSNINKTYEDAYLLKREKLSKSYKIMEYQTSIEFETTYHTEEGKIMKQLNQYISKIQSGKSNKCLLAIQSQSISKILNSCSSCSEFPTVQMNAKELSLPAVGWQQLISKRVVNHYFVLGSWIENLISLAKYGNLPLCNLQVDNVGHLIDIEYSRRLTENNIVLWWSPNPLPDLGGIENDFLPDYDSLNFPTINNPEIYESACLEIEVGTLTINTILTSALINEAEGAELADDIITGDKSNGGSTVAEDFFSVPALNTLRAMVKKWWDEALKGSNNADSMMNNLVTWVQRRDSYLYSYALHYHVHNLTIKSLLQLIGEFKKMNAQVIFANRNKLLVKTTKVSVENSYAYGQYLLRAARSKPMFSFLDLNITRYWDILIWMDEYNYGGRCCYNITSNDIQDLEPVNEWQLKKYLPIIYQNEFEDWLVIFLDAISKFKNESLLGTQNGTQRITQVQHILNRQKKLDSNEVNDEDIFGSVIDSFRAPFEKRIKRLYKRQIESILNPEMKEEYAFPQLPGSHLSMKNPTLELVKFLCAVFGLSNKRTIEVRVLRKDLLSFFEIKEFSPEAQFKYPCSSLKVPHVICDYCNYIRDLDFCRDEPESLWNCKRCQRPYHRVSLEEELIAQYQKLIVRFLHQDLICSKCKLIKADNMSEFCKCSGAWAETVSFLEVEKKIHTFSNVAKGYKLELLQGALTE